MKKKSITIFTESIAQIYSMSDSDAGALLKAILLYSLDGTEPTNCNAVIQYAFLGFKTQIDNENERRQELSEKRRQAVRTRWDNSSQGDTNEYKCMQMNTIVSPSEPPKPPAKTVKPDLEAIQKRQAEKKENFYNALIPFVELYGREMVREFFDYWTEPNKSKTKMRFELEKTWDLKRRLNTWDSRRRIPSNNQANGTGANPRTNSTEARQQRATGAADIIARLAAEDDAH